ncbi:MAG: uroporphyrinogen-III C-methyltransferase, partial [Myxococcales bacterium]|nr:uroporphyrinogen-III C-methyltransferase [Myxococcales bacterium]
MTETGTVYLVGAGPGDPGLATVRAMALIRSADVLVYDALVNPVLLEDRPAHCDLVYVGKRAKVHAVPQDQINELLVEWARAGKRVVRLKGGDPYIFGRGGEEGEFLYDRGVPFEVVPGITSPIAAPAYAGIPLSHRDTNSTITFITGHEKPEKLESTIPWDLLSSGKTTLAIIMGVGRLAHNMEMLRRGGMPGSMPVALVQWGTLPRQRSVVGTIDTIVEVVREAGIEAPAITIVGEVVAHRDKLNWFERRPLFGRRVVVTRAREQASGFALRLAELGAEPIEFPTIDIRAPESWEELDAALDAVATYDWLVFTSANGVRFTLERLRA